MPMRRGYSDHHDLLPRVALVRYGVLQGWLLEP